MLTKLSYYAHHTERYTDKQLYDFLRNITSHALKGGKVHIDAKGLENIPLDQNFIFYPNHQGFFDPVAIVGVCPVPLSIVYKKELKNTPFLKSVLACFHARAMDREDIRQSITVINNMAEDIKNGRNYLIFAEGTRSRNGNALLDFKGGSFKPAYKAQCLVVPVALTDTYKVFDTGNTKEITVKLEILPPIPYDEYKSLKSTELARKVHDQIEQAIEQATGNRTES
jgi:1-acyl-sn-glycerol-3-phosphate acyltransferase